MSKQKLLSEKEFELVTTFLKTDNNESLIDKVRRATKENRERLDEEERERINKKVEEDTPKYLILCLGAIADAVNSGDSKVTTRKYWPDNGYLSHLEAINIGLKVVANVANALREKEFEVYWTTCTEPEDSEGHGLDIYW